jgi:hypothetical protein
LADEPTPWEHQRTLAAIREDMREGFKGLNLRLDRVVSIELFNAHLESERGRHEEHEKDISEIKRDIEAIRELFKEATAKRTTDWKQALYNGLLPAAFLAVTLLVTILLAFKGGR